MADRSKPKLLRCAIYTRKSSEEGLEQDFNSLQAQREACEAYIKSQRHEGWTLIDTHYDDGGYSGGSMERPALQKLLEDIRNRKIDVVVVYKVDRLTRALTDFSKIVETFDQHGVSFVSVTQQFNTTSSMGRLTLNVLLSFAQFEREVTGERIRDKISASKKKGMWMGGFIPTGYDAKDRSLIINKTEAKTIQTIFQLYRNLKNVRLVEAECNRLKLRTKRYKAQSGRIVGGGPFSRGHIYEILKKPIYIGEITHNGTRYPGQHQPIIDKELWEEVQKILRANSNARLSKLNRQNASLLTGLLFDEDGNRLISTYTVKGSRRYRYYVNAPIRAVGARKKTDTKLRLSGPALEAFVIEWLAAFLRDQERVINALNLQRVAPMRIKAAITEAAFLASRIEDGEDSERNEIFLKILTRINVKPGMLSIFIRARELLTHDLNGKEQSDDFNNARIIPFDVPLKIHRDGSDTQLILLERNAPDQLIDRTFIKAIARGFTWYERLTLGKVKSIAEIAADENVTEAYVRTLVEGALIALSQSPIYYKQELEPTY